MFFRSLYSELLEVLDIYPYSSFQCLILNDHEEVSIISYCIRSFSSNFLALKTYLEARPSFQKFQHICSSMQSLYFMHHHNVFKAQDDYLGHFSKFCSNKYYSRTVVSTIYTTFLVNLIYLLAMQTFVCFMAHTFFFDYFAPTHLGIKLCDCGLFEANQDFP